MFGLSHIAPCPVGPLDGDPVLGTQKGYVRLLYVTQSTHDFNYIVQFNFSMCAIQYHMRELIGMGRKQDGLYYINGGDKVHLVLMVFLLNLISSIDGWVILRRK